MFQKQLLKFVVFSAILMLVSIAWFLIGSVLTPLPYVKFAGKLFIISLFSLIITLLVSRIFDSRMRRKKRGEKNIHALFKSCIIVTLLAIAMYVQLPSIFIGSAGDISNNMVVISTYLFLFSIILLIIGLIITRNGLKRRSLGFGVSASIFAISLYFFCIGNNLPQFWGVATDILLIVIFITSLIYNRRTTRT